MKVIISIIWRSHWNSVESLNIPPSLLTPVLIHRNASVFQQTSDWHPELVVLYSSGVVGNWNLSFHHSIQILFPFHPFENLLSCWRCSGRSKFLHGKFLVSTVDTAHFLLFSASSSISKGGSRKTPSGRVAESRRYRRKTSVRCSNLRRRLLAWTRSSSQVPGAQRPLFSLS